MDYHRRACSEIFGAPLWPDTEAVNRYFGAKEIPTTNIYFTNGSQDPWQHASITSSTDPAKPAFLIRCPHCSHCVDLKPPSWDDDENLRNARAAVSTAIGQWLSSSN